MRLRERDPDPQVKRELDALDAAIRGERVAADLASLAALAGELRKARPTLSAEFGAVLDAWAAEGFPEAASGAEAPAAAERRPRRRSWATRFRARPLAPLATGVAAIVLAAAVGTAVLLNEGGTDGERRTQSPTLDAVEGAPPAAQDLSEPGPTSGAEAAIEPVPGTTIPPAPPTDPFRPGQARIQERSAEMTLSTEPGEVDDVADEVVDVVDRYQGIVVSSNVSTDAEQGRATFDLRIPAQNLQATLADLSDLASVSSRDEGLRDVTAPFITAEERFDEAKAEVDALISELSEAGSEDEATAIRERLRAARSELAVARAELAGLKQRTNFSRLSVTVLGDGDADGWSLGDAAGDALNVLEDIAGAGLVALAVSVPLGALALVGGLGLRQYRRRSRERALDD